MTSSFKYCRYKIIIMRKVLNSLLITKARVRFTNPSTVSTFFPPTMSVYQALCEPSGKIGKEEAGCFCKRAIWRGFPGSFIPLLFMGFREKENGEAGRNSILRCIIIQNGLASIALPAVFIFSRKRS